MVLPFPGKPELRGWAQAVVQESFWLPSVLMAWTDAFPDRHEHLICGAVALLRGSVANLDESTERTLDALVAFETARHHGPSIAERRVLLAASGELAQVYSAAQFVASSTGEVQRLPEGRFALRRETWEAAEELCHFALSGDMRDLDSFAKRVVGLAAYRFAGDLPRTSASLTDFMRWLADAADFGCALRLSPLTQELSGLLQLAPSASTARWTFVEELRVPQGAWDDESRRALIGFVKGCLKLGRERFGGCLEELPEKQRERTPHSIAREAALEMIRALGEEIADKLAAQVAPEVIADYDPDPDTDNEEHLLVRALFEQVRMIQRSAVRCGVCDKPSAVVASYFHGVRPHRLLRCPALHMTFVRGDGELDDECRCLAARYERK